MAANGVVNDMVVLAVIKTCTIRILCIQDNDTMTRNEQADAIEHELYDFGAAFAFATNGGTAGVDPEVYIAR